MDYEDVILVPHERLGALIGDNGKTKRLIEERTGIRLEIDSKSGEVKIVRNEKNASEALNAMEIVKAIARGFSPEHAMALISDDVYLQVIDLEAITRNDKDLERQKARIIGEGGKARRMLEEATGAKICVYGKTVAIIGDAGAAELAAEAITALAGGTPHGDVYKAMRKRQRDLL